LSNESAVASKWLGVRKMTAEPSQAIDQGRGAADSSERGEAAGPTHCLKIKSRSFQTGGGLVGMSCQFALPD
jgi:hypothetical protein